MLGRALRKLDHRLAILGLVVILGGTVVAGVFGGWRLAGVAALILFVFLDGVSCLWTVCTHSTSEKIHEALDANERDRVTEKTRDNPTWR
jgi:uncharacterized membrane protein YqjE